MNCITQVTNELNEVIMQCTEKLRRYPRLQCETENLVSNFLRECETATRDQVSLLVEIELAYINTNHDDFIGFTNASKAETVKDVQSTVSQDTQLIKKGWLTTTNVGLTKGLSKEYWFVLTTDALAWFRDESERDQKYYLNIDGLKMKHEQEEEGGGGLFHRKHKIQLFHPTTRYLFREYRELSLNAKDEDEMEDWRASFLRAGIFPDRTNEFEESQDDAQGKPKSSLFEDAQLERQVEIIRTLVESYMNIVRKTFKDFIPKVIMSLLVNKCKYFIEAELMPSLYGVGSPNELMEESEDETRRREELLGMYHACKDALKTISEVNAKTTSAPLPPPVKGNHAVTPSPSPNMNAGRSSYSGPSGKAAEPPSRPTSNRSADPGRPASRPANRPAPAPPGGNKRPPPPSRPARPS